MRWKNRQVKLTLDVPSGYEDDEDFIDAMAATLDGADWQMKLEGGEVAVQVSKIQCGDAVAEPE